MAADRYPIPARAHRVEQTIQRSRFIATLAPASAAEAAREAVAAGQAEMPDATHHCWAFVAGPPGDTAVIGMSDAGEPHGTAGRPMLNVLLGSGVGEVVAVVTRYYGGVKLGRGGLGRAYAGSVQLALESLPTVLRVERTSLLVEVDYAAVDALRRELADLDGVIEEEEYGAGVRYRVAVPVDAVARLERGVASLTAGAGTVRRPEEG